MSITKAITLHPEYADAIAEGRKWIETRTPHNTWRQALARAESGGVA